MKSSSLGGLDSLKESDQQTENDIRQRIMIAAGQIFAEKGFDATTVREICSLAKVNLAAVNYYFRDKQNLYFETVSFARQVRAKANPLPTTDSDPRKRLKQFIQTLVNRTAGIADPPWQVQLLMREVLFPTEACRRLIEEYFRPFFNQLLSIIRELAPQQISEETAYRLGVSIVGQVMYLRFTSRMRSMFLSEQMVENHFNNEQIAEHIFQFSLAALQSESYWQATQSIGPPDGKVTRSAANVDSTI